MLASLGRAILLSAVLAYCQSTGPESSGPSGIVRNSPTATVTDTGITHTIAVGASGHKFTPGETKAKIGDTIEFKFYPAEHWVIRGDFDYPCIPYEYVGTDRRGFSSGEQPVQAITDDGPKFRVRVNDTEPIYFYCGAPGSCVRYHMMGVVNPVRNGTLDDWEENAQDVDFQLRPGDPWPSEVERPEIPTLDPEPSPSGGSDNTGDDEPSGRHSLNPGAIAGIVIGAILGLIALALVAFFCLRRRGFLIRRHRGPPTNVTQVTSLPPGNLPEQQSPSTVFDGSARQKAPYFHSQQQTRGLNQFGSPTSPPFSAVSYGSYYPPPPPSVSPQPTNGNEPVLSNPISQYHEHLQAYLQSHQASQQEPEGRSPVELPAMQEQDEPSLPHYKDTRFSWAGAEAGYKPSKGPHQD